MSIGKINLYRYLYSLFSEAKHGKSLVSALKVLAFFFQSPTLVYSSDNLVFDADWIKMSNFLSFSLAEFNAMELASCDFSNI
eukprot:g33291.t1